MPKARKSDMEFMKSKQTNGNIQITLNIVSSFCFLNEKKKKESFCKWQMQEFPHPKATRLLNCHMLDSQTAGSSSYVREPEKLGTKTQSGVNICAFNQSR